VLVKALAKREPPWCRRRRWLERRGRLPSAPRRRGRPRGQGGRRRGHAARLARHRRQRARRHRPRSGRLTVTSPKPSARSPTVDALGTSSSKVGATPPARAPGGARGAACRRRAGRRRLGRPRQRPRRRRPRAGARRRRIGQCACSAPAPAHRRTAPVCARRGVLCADRAARWGDRTCATSRRRRRPAARRRPFSPGRRRRPRQYESELHECLKQGAKTNSPTTRTSDGVDHRQRRRVPPTAGSARCARHRRGDLRARPSRCFATRPTTVSCSTRLG
jgi:hypothetical protein